MTIRVAPGGREYGDASNDTTKGLVRSLGDVSHTAPRAWRLPRANAW